MSHARDFLTHGVLPFVGRADECARISAFWRGTYEAHGLRIQVLTGEAGIGKSRLIAESIPAILDGGGAVVHVRLVPEATTSMVGPLAQALMHVESSRATTAPIEPSLPGVAYSLRRLARLRATILIIEDLHLLPADSVNELSTLLASLADESLAVLCAMRPVVTPSRAALERFVVDEIGLQGLAEKSIDEMWWIMTEGAPPTELTGALHSTTLGNPLALRSALRGAIASGALAPSSGHDWRLVEERPAFLRRLADSVGMVVEGLTLTLTPKQRSSTERLAMLGEVFSREAAALVIDDAGGTIDELVDSGILAAAPASAAPFGRDVDARSLLAFTHSLLHRALLERAASDVAAIAHVLVAGAPICSLVPLQLVREHCDAIPQALVAEVVVALATLIDWIDTTPDWRTADWLFDVAERLVDRLGEPDRSTIRLELERTRLETSHRGTPDERKAIADRILRCTESPMEPFAGAARMAAVSLQVWLGHDTTERGFAAVDAILERFPTLSSHLSYANALYVIGSALIFGDDRSGGAMARFIERVDTALATPLLERAVRERLLAASIFTLFGHFRSSADRDVTFARFDELTHESITIRTQAEMVRASRLMNVGRLAQANADAARVLVHYDSVGLNRYALASSIITILCRWSSTDATAELEPEIDRISDGLVANERLFFRRHLGINLATFSLLKGDVAAATRYASCFPGGLVRFGAPVIRALGLEVPVDHHGTEDRRESVVLDALAALEGDVDGDDAGSVTAIREAIDLEIVEIYDLVDLTALLTRASTVQLPPALDDSFAGAAERALEWLTEPGRSIRRFMPSFVERLVHFGGSRGAARWREAIEQLRRSEEAAARDEATGWIVASIVGTVSVTLPGAETKRLQGGRMRRLFAVLVAALLLKEELESDELAELVAGEDATERETRASIVKKTVHRLREIVGFDAVRTVKGAPRLNTDRVRVDLLEANALLDRSLESLRQGSTLAACHALRTSLAMTAGEVVFPSLYDSFFEAARDEFEGRQRRCVLKLAHHLIADGAAEEACALMRTALDALPGDDEIAELLQNGLLGIGRFLDAERIRMRMAGGRAVSTV
jgi:DNA-binding SARP family transcriptional activator